MGIMGIIERTYVSEPASLSKNSLEINRFKLRFCHPLLVCMSA